MGVNQTLRINVTPQVREMFLAVDTATLPPVTWELGCNMGFVFVGMTNSPGLFKFWRGMAKLRIQIQEPPWRRANSEVWVPLVPQIVPHRRKSSAMVYDYNNGLFTLFAGVDGNRVLDDTWVSPDGFTWTILYPPHRPPARWAHGMVYGKSGVLVFGGFDSKNRPLNDLWHWDGADWTEINVFSDDNSGTPVFVNDRPPPRGAMAFGTYANRIPALFGGTDGKRYINDTWILQEAGFARVGDTNDVPAVSTGWRWILVCPSGEMFHPAAPPAPTRWAPVARAYPYVGPDYAIRGLGMTMLMFGGRLGTLPTSTDTDQDWVSDGMEVALGGPDAGRDPRANGLILASRAVNTNAVEKIPYNYKLLGPMVWTPMGIIRLSYIADFESLWHSHEPGPGPERIQSTYSGFPGEGRRTPPPTTFPIGTGFGAMMAQYSDLWWHQFGGTPPNDPRDEWELGSPMGTGGDNLAPRYAYSGRWCYGTDLDGSYEHDTVAELYSPLIHLTVPDPRASSGILATNDWYLVFHEWLDLADRNDVVWVDAVRPNPGPHGELTSADILLRKSGTEPPRPLINVLPPRNNAYNTTGEWRRVIVPLTLKQPNIFLKFVLQSDGANKAGGWYIDDVAVMQAGELVGTYAGPGDVYLYGIQGTNVLQVDTPHNQVFSFSLLPAGDYRLVSGNGSMSFGTVADGQGTWHLTIPNLQVNEIVLDIMINSPALISWNAVPGGRYEVQYATPESLMSDDPWSTLGTVVPTTTTGQLTDWDSETARARFYRVVFKGMTTIP
jgi:hypothetical protein